MLAVGFWCRREGFLLLRDQCEPSLHPMASTSSAAMAARLVKNSTLKVYAGESHGICTTQPDRVNADLLAFLED
jgi:pimeloyl-ACP methyl ester carboxylesterase